MDEQTIAQTSLDFESLDRTITDAFTTPILSDSLDAVGLRDRVMIAGISPVQPGLRAIGRAQTVSFDPDPIDRPDPYRAAIDVIDSLLPGSVLVIETGGDQRSAYWGELFTAAAIGRGAAGIVTDGPTRDTPGSGPSDTRCSARALARLISGPACPSPRWAQPSFVVTWK